MKTLGCINGKVHIMQDVCNIIVDRGKSVKNVTVGIRIAAGANAVMLTPAEAVDLADIVTYAATDQLHLLPDCPTFKSAEKGDCNCD